MPSRSEAFFAHHGSGPHHQRYAWWHQPEGVPAHALVVYAPPFAEEMNKSRRMAAWQSRVLAAQGCAVLQMDLLGCGDSGGDFADASWEAWVDDIRFACHLALQRFDEQWPQAPAPSLWLWGLRAGCLLAAEAACHETDLWNLLLWQPQAQGKQVLQQFLRLKAASAMGESDGGQALKQARADLAAGQVVDVAGYPLPPGVALGLEQARLQVPKANRRVVWLELSLREEPALLPASAPVLDALRAAGHAVTAEVVAGPAFWSTLEIEDAPALVQASAKHLRVEAAA
jgi:exosortase A-associated hydrolase 2